jgi:LacI family transcriptional regulator
LVTIKDIALNAGVSIGTVDRVLHGRGRVSKNTSEKINAIVKKTGYKANIHGRNLSLKTDYCFGVIMPQPQQDSNYWDILRRGIDQSVKDLSSFNVNVKYFFFDKYSERSFCEAASRAIKADIHGLIITPVLSDACPAFVKSIPTELPYLYVDSIVPETTPVAYIGQNSFQSGVCGAKLMHLLVRDKGKVAVIRMLPNDFHINERVNGFMSYIKKISAINARVFDVNGSMCDSDFIKTITKIEAEFGDCNGFFVTNAETHRVAKSLSKSAGVKKHIVGYDLVDENRRLVQENVIDFIISQKTMEQGHRAINMLFHNIILKEPCIKEVLMPIDIITAENLMFYQ